MTPVTNLDHLESAERCLKREERPIIAHVVQDAREEIVALRNERYHLRAALTLIVSAIPAVGPDGPFIEHFDLDGEPTGIELVDPLAVLQCIEGCARAALEGKHLVT